jgi:hypothetical protein
MRPDIVIIVAPEGQRLAGVGEAVKDLLVQALVKQAAVEALDRSVLPRLARSDATPGGAGIASPFEDCGAGELGAVVADNAVWFVANQDQRRQLPRHLCARDAGVGDRTAV